MTPYEIEVLLHYYSRRDDHQDAIRLPPIWQPTIELFMRESLVERGLCVGGVPTYSITERGRVYIDALQTVPLPDAQWVVQWPATFWRQRPDHAVES